MRSLYLALAGAALLGMSGPAYVHHSGAMFDRTRQMQLTGTVTEFNWTNPHASFKLDVMGTDGKAENWDIEMNGVSNLVVVGWKRSTLKPGDKVTVTVNPLRDGRPGGWYISVTLPDGRTLGGGDQSPGEGGAAADKPASSKSP